jgi:hypothetical protein
MKNVIMKKLSLGTIICVACALAGCDKVAKQVDKEVNATTSSVTSAVAGDAFKLTLADGPAACLTAYKEKIGQDFKILDFSTFYVLPETIDIKATSSYKGSKGGEMKSCDIKIQDPTDEKKAVGYQMDMKTGAIKGPIPVEISVSGDAESFKLNEVVYPAGGIDFAAIQGNIDALKPKLDAKYSVYQVSGIRMDSDLRTGKPHFLVHIDGKLKGNDVKKNELITLSPDGKKVLGNSLK